MDPVQTLSSKGITEKNKHCLETLADLLASYSFRDEKNRLRATKDIVDQVHAISILLKEVAGSLQPDCNGDETDETESLWRTTKRRRTLSRSNESFSRSLLQETDHANYLSLQRATREHHAPAYCLQQKSVSSKTLSSHHGLDSGDEFWREDTALEDNTIPDGAPGLGKHANISDTPIQHSLSTTADWLWDLTLPDKEGMMVIIKSPYESYLYGEYEGKVAIVSSVLNSGDPTQSRVLSPLAHLKILPDMKDLTVPVVCLEPCLPTTEGDKVKVFRGLYAGEEEWRFVEPINESDVLLESEKSRMVQPISAVVRYV